MRTLKSECAAGMNVCDKNGLKVQLWYPAGSFHNLLSIYSFDNNKHFTSFVSCCQITLFKPCQQNNVWKNELYNNIVHFETFVDNVIHSGIITCDIYPALLALALALVFGDICFL